MEENMTRKLDDDKIIINVEDVKKIKLEWQKINHLNLDKIVIKEDGKVINISQKTIEAFRFTGLNTMNFFLTRFWEKENEK